MKIVLCGIVSSLCLIIATEGHSRLQVTIHGTIDKCPDFDEKNLKIDLRQLKFIQRSDYDFILSGKYTISENIDGPISISITSKKCERVSWVNSLLNQNLRDVCAEMEKANRPGWLKIFDDWTADKRCPFIAKVGEYKDFLFFNSQKASELLPPTFYGKYKTESRFHQIIDGEMVEIACYITVYELAGA